MSAAHGASSLRERRNNLGRSRSNCGVYQSAPLARYDTTAVSD
jgi:hypothetical protein